MTFNLRPKLCLDCCHIPDSLQQLKPPISPVPELLRTLHLPLLAQLSDIKNTILEGQESLATLDAKIVQIQTALDELGQQRTAIDKYVREHQALFSPIRRLPFELLGKIFAICADEIPLRRLFWGPRDVPWSLTQVCVGWQNVALATPGLWSRLNLDVWDRFSDRYLAMVRKWIARSGSLPLTITFEDNFTLKLRDSGEHDPLAKLLSACSDRWQTVTLDMVYSGYLHNTELSLSSLQSAALSCSRPSGQGISEIIYDFRRAYQLRYLHIYHPLSFVNFEIQWSQLAEVHLTSVPIGDCLQILKQCSNVTFVTFLAAKRHPFPDPSIVRRISLDSVQTLHVSLMSPEVIAPTSLMDISTLPNLRDLEFTHTSPYHLNSFSQITALVYRSGCNLERLTVTDNHMFEDDILNCLRSCPSLTELDLNLRKSDFLIVRALRELTFAELESDALPVLPKLRVLKARHLDGPFFPQEMFLDMCELRWSGVGEVSLGSPVACLQKVQVVMSGCYEPSAPIMERLERLRGEGMEILIEAEH